MVDEPMRVRVLRPEDLLVLDISMINLSLGGDGHLHVVNQQTGSCTIELATHRETSPRGYALTAAMNRW